MRGMIDHIDLTVSDPELSLGFYEAVLGFMGYRLTASHERGFDFDCIGPGGAFTSVGIMRAERNGAKRQHDRYSPGLHHLAWKAESREDVDELCRLLVGLGATILDPPAEYPDYGEAYYAVFFADPDGLKLEFVHWPRQA